MTDIAADIPAETPATEPTSVRENRRTRAKAATRQKAIDVARRLFADKPYAQVTMRDLAREMQMSTGAVSANFEDKAALWRAAMGCEPPLDSPAVRAAPAMLAALKGLLAIRPVNWMDEEDFAQAAAWRAAAVAAATAEGQDADDLTDCLACRLTFLNDDQVLADVSGEFLHAACCGPELEAYVNLDTGEPIGPSDPIPTGYRWGDAR